MKPGWEWLLVLLIVLLLFGAKRLPDTARSLGRSMRILKAETKGLHDDDADRDAEPGSPAGSTAPGGPSAAQAPPPALPPAGTSLAQPGSADVASSVTSVHRSDDR